MNATTDKRKSPAPRRRIGRPAGITQSVGRDALITKTCELLAQWPANEVTRAAVARAMNVDPSLIRYYFRDRAALLLAAIEKMTDQFLRVAEEEGARGDDSAVSRLRARLGAQLNLNSSYPFFHQLVVNELPALDTPVASRLQRELTKRGIDHYTDIVKAGVNEQSLRAVDPRFLFIAIIGMCDFFVSGMPMLLKPAEQQPRRLAALRQQYLEFICNLLLDGLRVRAPRS
ncbi:MAG TPA: hypothetical protein VMI92_04930 [Steroidobacteraceae bacterium]|nr:hypothetical protein [Steroidobacteraceae bacterium]